MNSIYPKKITFFLKIFFHRELFQSRILFWKLVRVKKYFQKKSDFFFENPKTNYK
jgi:hypothetical protein